jgi:DUF4097 and DUF4098 domain-containing protein YvlB
MSAYTNHGKNISEEEQWAKINIDRKRSSCIEKNCFEKSRTIATQVTAELNIHLEDPVSTKTVRGELHTSNIHGRGRAATAKPLITESSAQLHK